MSMSMLNTHDAAMARAQGVPDKKNSGKSVPYYIYYQNSLQSETFAD
jgi:hypothetical protein